jgi:hypothetical protein
LLRSDRARKIDLDLIFLGRLGDPALPVRSDLQNKVVRRLLHG